jgi:hypothetical protein
MTSALAGGEWLASRPGLFTSGEIASGTRWIGGWVDPRAGLDDLEKKNQNWKNVLAVFLVWRVYSVYSEFKNLRQLFPECRAFLSSSDGKCC